MPSTFFNKKNISPYLCSIARPVVFIRFRLWALRIVFWAPGFEAAVESKGGNGSERAKTHEASEVHE